ncbi:FAD binding domain-containing protein [Paraburkholderia sp. SARCC-3016]|jgi:CO/xanthine dehydrogenase FAD-binding subunit|uniref:FAD binding domain-containing protein n=1 Tax=Paraburkholderia sp. SARCC-3016 TaxID=3058611 RepID=UPI002808F19D|nr:FAD binding domain-containing protein [Paraburkholderia sp. SARCC-3016]MDQ7978289.1 FAD binding domain-containing protein [Paraburkholderia sp. SARCC-3016]
MSYVLAASEGEALEALDNPDFRIVCGGTDWFGSPHGRAARSASVGLVDISRIPALRAISLNDGWLRIGAATTWSDIVRYPLEPRWRALQDAARMVGSAQIQHRASVGGNLCNGSPAADGTVALLALDAEVELGSRTHSRRLPLQRFLTGKNAVDLHRSELLEAVWLPPSPTCCASSFVKFGVRRQLNISIASVAVRVADDAELCRIAAGSVGPAPVRLRGFEAQLACAPAHGNDALEHAAIPEIAPIDDFRATSPYRRHLVRELARRAIELARLRL